MKTNNDTFGSNFQEDVMDESVEVVVDPSQNASEAQCQKLRN